MYDEKHLIKLNIESIKKTVNTSWKKKRNDMPCFANHYTFFVNKKE